MSLVSRPGGPRVSQHSTWHIQLRSNTKCHQPKMLHNPLVSFDKNAHKILSILNKNRTENSPDLHNTSPWPLDTRRPAPADWRAGNSTPSTPFQDHRMSVPPPQQCQYNTLSIVTQTHISHYENRNKGKIVKTRDFSNQIEFEITWNRCNTFIVLIDFPTSFLHVSIFSDFYLINCICKTDKQQHFDWTEYILCIWLSGQLSSCFVDDTECSECSECLVRDAFFAINKTFILVYLY